MDTPRVVTLADFQTWPPVIDVRAAADVFGISNSAAYAAIATGTFPARTIKVGKRTKVITASIIDALSVAA